MKTTHSATLVLSVILLVSMSIPSHGNVNTTLYSQASPILAEQAKVILQQGTNSSSLVYTNNTSAVITITSPLDQPQDFADVLRIVNQASNNWTISLALYDSSNVERLVNATIILQNGSNNDQITINNGNTTQAQGQPCDFATNVTAHVSIMNLQATNNHTTSQLYTYLKILTPDTSTYDLLTITFEIK